MNARMNLLTYYGCTYGYDSLRQGLGEGGEADKTRTRAGRGSRQNKDQGREGKLRQQGAGEGGEAETTRTRGGRGS